MNPEAPQPPPAPPEVAPLAEPPDAPGSARPAADGVWRAVAVVVLAALAVLAGVAVSMAWSAQQRVKALESELVRRQQDSATQAAEARALARQGADAAREAGARVVLLEARLAETALQRTQLDDLIQGLARSRDDSVLLEIEAALRVASQQAAITGSAQPLILALTQAEERLARYSLPRMEQVRRAVARDLEAARRAGGADLGLLSLRLDEALRGVDELPLIAQARAGGLPDAGPRPPSNPPLAEPEALQEGWRAWLARQIRPVLGAVVQEVRGLVRVSRIDQPEALLLAPEQAFFLRENLKLRLLNARLALLSRQFDTVQADLGQADAALQRWFDPDSRRVQQLRETLRQVAAQSRSVELPRPEATLSAIATVTATGR